MAYTALLDACVLYSAPIRDLLLRLALADLYRAKWTEDIHEEWMRNLAANRPDLPPDRIQRTRTRMDENVRDALVEDYHSLIPALSLPDPNDRHVLAAAIVGRADVIMTENLADFPPEALAPYGIDVQGPDEFLSHLLDLAPDLVCAVVRDLREALGKPAMNAEEYLVSLERHGVGGFAASLRARIDRI